MSTESTNFESGSEVKMTNEIFTTGMSSVSVSRSTKGDYSYDIKIYHSGKGRAPFAALKRIDEMRRELEKRLGIAASPEDESAFATFAQDMVRRQRRQRRAKRSRRR